MKKSPSVLIVTAACTMALTACTAMAPVQESAREQDRRNDFAPAVLEKTFAALAGSAVESDRWSGMLGNAAYRVEVPKNWNGRLAVYAHGYTGTVNALAVQTPLLRRYLIENGYAWAASSYSKNYYDVQAGVEDTNALALAFNQIAVQNGHPLLPPTRIYAFGNSMGGHIVAAAIEAETLATARNKVRYDGALPMCGVLGDTELFDHFAAYQLAAQQLAGLPATSFPTSNWAAISGDVRMSLFGSTTAYVPSSPQGERLKNIVMNLTGGQRPIFDEGFTNPALQNILWGASFGAPGNINGILPSDKSVIDTRRIRYQCNAPQPVVDAFNASIVRATADADANPLRLNGLRWVPKVHAEFAIPVLTLHTLGDMYVPFMMEQIYLQRAQAKGTSGHLVQRAIRAPGHCDFTAAEQSRAFGDLVKWVEAGVKPTGDDVITPAVVAQPNYGCAFTDNTLGPDDTATAKTWRAAGKLPACQK